MLHSTLFVHGIAEGRIVNAIKPRSAAKDKDTQEAGRKPDRAFINAIAIVDAHPSQQSQPLMVNFPMILG